MSFRKIGGIYWLSLGRIRISFCVKRKTRITVAELLALENNHVVVRNLLEERDLRFVHVARQGVWTSLVR